ncbi:amidohydrolase family protein [Cohnella lubricantis]|uniref:Amidohydrolase family protein n=1 Tax=Cohnella lubricantis TaxID=2163172 RepID=A0A841TD40_9BACL|nr:amidohydrolase family protein [Cohnella lubricantis]MBB6677150.1 amidohydrolase family protein [Cohnella lubricantis]MBP2117039.1 cytosine deaminase [Cohnella lubricantis]
MERLDWLIRGALDPRSGERVDIGLQGGRIALIRPIAETMPLPSSIRTFDGDGYAVLPGLAETHIHLDKAFLSSRLPGVAAGLQQAIEMTAALKSSYTADDIKARSREVLNRASAFGVTLLRAQVEIDPILGLMSFESALELKREYVSAMDVQLVAFPQEGIFWQPGTAELLERAVRMGADAVGGIPYNDRDSSEHLDYLFRLAEVSGLPVDLHLDFSDDPRQLAIQDVIALTRKYGMQGRVAVGHLTSLGSVELDAARRIAAGIAEAGIHVFTLPATDLYLNGRQDTCRVRRGLTPVRLLLEEGASVCFGSNNIRNAFTPFGTGDPLDIGLLLAQTAYMGTSEDVMTVLGMCTTQATLAIRGKKSDILEGATADLALVRADSAAGILYDRPRDRVVWKDGQLVGERANASA